MKFLAIALVLFAAHIANAETKSCKVHSSDTTFVFNENLREASVRHDNDETLLISANTICGQAVSSDCYMKDHSNANVLSAQTHCRASDSHASIVYSINGRNGRVECRAGRQRQLVEFFDCQ
ncbi:hypothetical protein EON80_25970 [bacterium]|nr:MAG: hypothetical protein EON80_25970 [bacterium]